MLIGYLRDRTGTYRTGFIVLIGIALLGAVAIASLSRKVEVRDQKSEVRDQKSEVRDQKSEV
jgi:cyanate permease